MHNFHGASAKHIRRADDHWKANSLDNGAGLFGRMGNAIFRLQQVKLFQQELKALTILGKVNGVRAGAKDWDAFGLERGGNF